MSRMSPEEFARKIGAGLLSFPVTHFTSDGFAFDEPAYREHIDWLLEHKPAGLFAAGGTGEYFSLTLEEYSAVVAAAVQQTNHRVPVVAGCGYGTAMAKQFARAGEAAGADGLLLFPPYLINADPAGLAAHVEAVCASTKLGVIFYNRDNAILNEVWLETNLRAVPEPGGFQGWVRRHRVDDAHLRAHGRPADLHRRSAHGGDLCAAVSGDGCDHVLVGDLQFSTAVRAGLSMQRCGGATMASCSRSCGSLCCRTSTFAIGTRAMRCRL